MITGTVMLTYTGIILYRTRRSFIVNVRGWMVGGDGIRIYSMLYFIFIHCVEVFGRSWVAEPGRPPGT